MGRPGSLTGWRCNNQQTIKKRWGWGYFIENSRGTTVTAQVVRLLSLRIFFRSLQYPPAGFSWLCLWQGHCNTYKSFKQHLCCFVPGLADPQQDCQASQSLSKSDACASDASIWPDLRVSACYWTIDHHISVNDSCARSFPWGNP